MDTLKRSEWAWKAHLSTNWPYIKRTKMEKRNQRNLFPSRKSRKKATNFDLLLHDIYFNIQNIHGIICPATHKSISYPCWSDKQQRKWRWLSSFSPRNFTRIFAPILKPIAIMVVPTYTCTIQSTKACNSSVLPAEKVSLRFMKVWNCGLPTHHTHDKTDIKTVEYFNIYMFCAKTSTIGLKLYVDKTAKSVKGTKGNTKTEYTRSGICVFAETKRFVGP